MTRVVPVEVSERGFSDPPPAFWVVVNRYGYIRHYAQSLDLARELASVGAANVNGEGPYKIVRYEAAEVIS